MGTRGAEEGGGWGIHYASPRPLCTAEDAPCGFMRFVFLHPPHPDGGWTAVPGWMARIAGSIARIAGSTARSRSEEKNTGNTKNGNEPEKTRKFIKRNERKYFPNY